MLIDRITVYALSVPFKMAFAHARKKTPGAESVVVKVQAGTATGHGEGAPRIYVTGEGLHGACSAVEQMVLQKEFPWEISDLDQIGSFIASNEEKGAGNAARCALETALIDAFARSLDMPAPDLFPGRHRVPAIRYGATIPLGSPERISGFCRMINDLGMDAVRLKLGTDRDSNLKALQAVRERCGPGCDLRVDINGAWKFDDFLFHLPMLRGNGVCVVEQPLAPGDRNLADAALCAEKEGVLLMADEEACTARQIDEIIQQGHFRMVNVRLSKCGGIHASMAIVERLRNAGISFQIGCQLGETGVLSAAGRALGILCGDARYHDGSYDAFLLEENITVKDISFGFGGEAGPLEGPGFGMNVVPAKLVRLSDGKQPIEITR